MTVPATISLTEQQVYQALIGFVQSVLPATVTVQQGLVNLVPEPVGPFFVIVSPLRRSRLGTNEVQYYDNIFTGAISATILTVSAFAQSEGPGLQPGTLLLDTANPTNLAANTIVTAQTGGTPGGVGTYTVTPSQTVAAETMYGGVRAGTTETEFVAQVDFYGSTQTTGGPSSADYAEIFSSLFRSQVATAYFEGLNIGIDALYADEPRQIAFIDAEQQYEERWLVEAHLQINPVIGTPEQFFSDPQITLVDVQTTYPA